MRVLIAMDSFKGSLSAMEATEVVAKALNESLPNLKVKTCPMADGGEGSLEVILTNLPGGTRTHVRCAGPLPGIWVNAEFGYWPKEEWAVIEAAQACGLPLLHHQQRDPWNATTEGVGELLSAAEAFRPKKITIAVGGTATMDGGIGLAHALGWQGLAADGCSLSLTPANIPQVAHLVPPSKSIQTELEIWADVRTPLLGPQGAAPLFGPQKGASPDQVLLLAKRFETLNRLWQKRGIPELGALPGGGAAGGLAAGLMAFCGGRLEFGADQMLHVADLEQKIRDADWVLTGEGQFDETSLQNKCVQKVAALCQTLGKPVIVLAGWVKLNPSCLGAVAGFSASTTACNQAPPPQLARRELYQASLEVARFLKHPLR